MTNRIFGIVSPNECRGSTTIIPWHPWRFGGAIIRIEIISPGHLPNNLTVEKIRNGNSNIRNPILVSYVAKGLLPYHGLGSGIKRALEQWPQIEFADDQDGCLFQVTVTRKPVEELNLVDADASGNGPRTPIAPKNAPKSGENASINAPRNLLHRQILDLIRSNPQISYDDLARLTGKDRTTVMRNISKLKTLGSLKRIGSKKTGYWEIIESHKP